jgi:hypothetical protein
VVLWGVKETAPVRSVVSLLLLLLMRERHWKRESGIWNLVPLKILLESFIEGLT